MAFSLEKYQQICQEIERICVKVGRNPAEIKLLAATKYAAVEDINKALEAGIDLIGENKVQDAQGKFAIILPSHRHFIGHLQGNKVKVAVSLFEMIESVDSLKLATIIQKEALMANKVMPILLEVNIANDAHKFGFKAEEVLPVLEKLQAMKALNVKGLMGMVPFSENSEEVRPFFQEMHDLFVKAKKIYPAIDTLSMGMSHDYKVAIEEGSTEIRIGSLLFN